MSGVKWGRSRASLLRLKPNYVLWLLDENLLPEDGLYTHDYKLRDPAGNTLLMHGGICLF